jgi:pimeloyl-ACP methyl ester carboxylesterase
MQFKLLSDRFKGCSYLKEGNGPNIILLHGFAEDGRIWKNQISELAKEFTVSVPDLPGSGSSPLPQENMSMTLLADFVSELLIQEKIEKTILFGHSMGGYAALAFAEKYPNSLLGLSLVHSSAIEDDETKKENRLKSIKLIKNDGKEVFLKAMIPNLYSENSKLSKQHQIEEHLTMAMGISSIALQAYYYAMIERPSRIHILQHTKVPVQFVIGRKTMQFLICNRYNNVQYQKYQK